MIQPEPNNNLALSRLVIYAQGDRVFDQKFTNGVNVIWGKNGAGKSTILDTVYYCLGGNDIEWKDVANRFEKAVLEVSFNGELVTLLREFGEGQQKISFYWGDLESGIKDLESWIIHPARTTKHQDSYSDVIFSLLGWPVIDAEDFNKITMTQILRLVYGDQPSPPTRIFREAGWDSEQTKEALGDFIIGSFSSELYTLKGRLKSANNELSAKRGEVKALQRFVQGIDETTSLSDTQSEIDRLHGKIAGLYKDLDSLDVEEADEFSATEIEEAYNDFEFVNAELVASNEKISNLEFETRDSAEFIAALQENLLALDEASTARDAIADVHFEYCPACLSRVEPAQPGHCNLCKTKLTDDSLRKHRMRARYELSTQIEESNRILASRREELENSKQKRTALDAERRSALSRYKNLTESASAATSGRKGEMFVEIGTLEERITSLSKRLELHERLETTQNEIADLLIRIDELEGGIEAQTASVERIRRVARKLIDQETVWFLHRDLDRQVEFTEAEHVDFNFGKEIIAVDGIRRFSDSGQVYLKNSFLVALLSASTKTHGMCMPRFLMLDGIEDKGMEVERIHQLQENIFEKCSEFSETEFQVIFTATTLSESLANKVHILGGRKFDRENRIIRI